jgi:hypothetical protein
VRLRSQIRSAKKEAQARHLAPLCVGGVTCAGAEPLHAPPLRAGRRIPPRQRIPPRSSRRAPSALALALSMRRSPPSVKHFHAASTQPSTAGRSYLHRSDSDWAAAMRSSSGLLNQGRPNTRRRRISPRQGPLRSCSSLQPAMEQDNSEQPEHALLVASRRPFAHSMRGA